MNGLPELNTQFGGQMSPHNLLYMMSMADRQQKMGLREDEKQRLQQMQQAFNDYETGGRKDPQGLVNKIMAIDPQKGAVVAGHFENLNKQRLEQTGLSQKQQERATALTGQLLGPIVEEPDDQKAAAMYDTAKQTFGTVFPELAQHIPPTFNRDFVNYQYQAAIPALDRFKANQDRFGQPVTGQDASGNPIYGMPNKKTGEIAPVSGITPQPSPDRFGQPISGVDASGQPVFGMPNKGTGTVLPISGITPQQTPQKPEMTKSQALKGLTDVQWDRVKLASGQVDPELAAKYPALSSFTGKGQIPDDVKAGVNKALDAQEANFNYWANPDQPGGQGAGASAPGDQSNAQPVSYVQTATNPKTGAKIGKRADTGLWESLNQ